MKCFQCNTHYCYLCSSWLDGNNPYAHFNKPGSPCFQRLWELEEGDDGQAPGDGRGFIGARGWEQLAIEVAREAEAQEAAAAAQAQIDAEVDDKIADARDVNDEERQQQELQRFLDLALRDEEDGWDSDELGENDEGFVIH